MAPETVAPEPTGAEQIHWDLSDLYASPDLLLADLPQQTADAEAFAERYRGRIALLSADELAEALTTLGDLLDRMLRGMTYAYLHWSTETTASDRGALLQKIREHYTQAHQTLLFFELEWTATDADHAEALLFDEKLTPYAHHLHVLRLHKPHQLSEPEEKILSEKSITGMSAWQRFFDETLGAAQFTFRDQTLTEQEVLAKLYAPDRTIRHDAALSLTEGLGTHLRTLAYVFNTMLADKASTDRLRQYPQWITARNMDNQASDATIEALIAAVTNRYDLVARFYTLKRELLGLDELFDYDRYAPIETHDRRFSWDDAKELVLDAYTLFHPDMGYIASQFFEERWIDAAVQAGKRGGAFSHGAVPSVHPYILMNYTGKIRDVQTLAHELGHGVHQYLSRQQGIFHASTPLTTAETASVFGEMLTFQQLLAREPDPQVQLALLIGKIDDTIATVFRQVALNRFEDRLHTARRETGELAIETINQHWIETQSAMFKGSVTLGAHYQTWWSYIPHFIHTPGYVYAYAFGELLVLALYAHYQEEGVDFPDKYLDLLAAGGSDWPHNLVAPFGVNLEDPDFWHTGLRAIELFIESAETLARDLNNVAE